MPTYNIIVTRMYEKKEGVVITANDMEEARALAIKQTDVNTTLPRRDLYLEGVYTQASSIEGIK